MIEDTETDTDSDDESSDTDDYDDDDDVVDGDGEDDDDNEVFIPSEVDRELLLVSRCCCHARRMRLTNFEQ